VLLTSEGDPLVAIARRVRGSSASLDYRETLERITRLLVPELADWCLLDMVEDNGSVNQLAAAHAEEEKEDLI
jgi:hypothetical protein